MIINVVKSLDRALPPPRCAALSVVIAGGARRRSVGGARRPRRAPRVSGGDRGPLLALPFCRHAPPGASPDLPTSSSRAQPSRRSCSAARPLGASMGGSVGASAPGTDAGRRRHLDRSTGRAPELGRIASSRGASRALVALPMLLGHFACGASRKPRGRRSAGRGARWPRSCPDSLGLKAASASWGRARHDADGVRHRDPYGLLPAERSTGRSSGCATSCCTSWRTSHVATVSRSRLAGRLCAVLVRSARLARGACAPRRA